MTKVKVNYGRVHLLGSIMFAALVVSLPTVILYKFTGSKIGALLFFFPVLILATRVSLWTQERVVKEEADSLRRRYKAGRVPIGKDH